MKPNLPMTVLALTLGLVAAAPAGESLLALAKTKVKPRITDAALQKQQSATLPSGGKRAIAMKELRPEGRQERDERRGLIARSAIISSGTHWTIVPKEALLHVPGHMEARINGKRTGRLLPWHKFWVLNRNWIVAHSVGLDTASGEKPLDEKTRKVHRDIGRVVVAVCQGGPISVKTPPAEEPTLALAPEAP